MKLTKLDCWWRGHDLVNSTEDWRCAKCGQEIDYHELVQVCAKTKLTDWFAAKRNWFKCSECGWRFGQHDPSVNHCPF